MSTTVVYASGESGDIYHEDATYLNAARGDGTPTVTATSQVAQVGQLDSYYVFQAFLLWDTSAVGIDTVNNVDFEVDGHFDLSTIDFVLETYAYTWSGGGLTSADFRDSDSGIPALGSIIAQYDTSGGWVLTAGYNQTMGALTAFNTAINGSGNTEVVVISQEHRNESAPTDSERVVALNTGSFG